MIEKEVAKIKYNPNTHCSVPAKNSFFCFFFLKKEPVYAPLMEVEGGGF